MKETKRQENEAKTKFVMDMMKAEQEARIWTNNYRNQLRSHVNQAMNGWIQGNHSIGKDVKT